MKKTLSILLAALMILAVLPLAAAEEAPRYHYTLCPYGDGATTDRNVQMINEKYNVDFEIIHVEHDVVDEAIALLAASGELPDIISITNNSFLLEQGLLGTWTEEFFREHCPNLSAGLDEYCPEAWLYCKTTDGMMFYTPHHDDTATNDPVAWNATWLKNLGVETIPDTLDDWHDIFYMMAHNDPDGNGIDDTYAISNTAFIGVYGAYGFQRKYWISDDNGGVVYGDVNPRAKEALATLAQWYAEGLIIPEFVTGERAGGYWALANEFVAQKIGCTLLGHDYHYMPAMPEYGFDIPYESMGTNGQAVVDSGNPFDWAFSAPPVGPEGYRGVEKRNNTPVGDVYSADLVADADRFARLLEVIDDICGTTEGYLFANYGVEGEDWQIVELPGGATEIQSIDREAELGKFGTGNTFNFASCHLPEVAKHGGYRAMFRENVLPGLTDYAIYNLVKDTLPSFETYNAECEKILNEGYIAIITGAKPVDYFDEMVKAWYNAGGTQLTAEANAIYASRK